MPPLSPKASVAMLCSVGFLLGLNRSESNIPAVQLSSPPPAPFKHKPLVFPTFPYEVPEDQKIKFVPARLTPPAAADKSSATRKAMPSTMAKDERAEIQEDANAVAAFAAQLRDRRVDTYRQLQEINVRPDLHRSPLALSAEHFEKSLASLGQHIDTLLKGLPNNESLHPQLLRAKELLAQGQDADLSGVERKRLLSEDAVGDLLYLGKIVYLYGSLALTEEEKGLGPLQQKKIIAKKGAEEFARRSTSADCLAIAATLIAKTALRELVDSTQKPLQFSAKEMNRLAQEAFAYGRSLLRVSMLQNPVNE